MRKLLLIGAMLTSSAAVAQTPPTPQSHSVTPKTGPLAGGEWIYVTMAAAPTDSKSGVLVLLNKRSLALVSSDNVRFQVATIGKLVDGGDLVKIDVDADCAAMRYRFIGTLQYDAKGNVVFQDRDPGGWLYYTNDKSRSMDFVTDSVCKGLRSGAQPKK